MYHITETKKQNKQREADLENSRQGRFTTLRDGGILLSCGGRSKTLEKGRDDQDITDFLNKVRGKSSGIVREAVKAFFQPITS